jgi:hypothetical protein
VKITLKKEWMSPRGNSYPVGTVFIKSKLQSYQNESTWYDFNIPNKAYGSVLIHNKVFRRLTKDELSIKAARQKSIKNHIKATTDPFIRSIN